MKAFANITLGELNGARYEMRRIMRGIPAEIVDDMVCWNAVGEYIHDTWGCDYDDDDIEFVYSELCMSPDAKHLYVFEVQECEDGTELLYIEVIMNGQ